MIVAIARAEFHLPAARSLKDKRRFLNSLTDRLHRRLRVSVAETGFQDLRQRAEVGIAFVHWSRSEAEAQLEGIHDLCEDQIDGQLALWEADFLEQLS